MRKILALAAVLFSLSAQAQFNSTDSLHRYNNRHIRNSPVEAFNNLRLNTLLHGIIQWIDSARLGEGGAIGVDSVYAINDSTVRYRKNSISFDFPLKGIYDFRRKVDSGYVYNDSIIRLIINGANRDFTLRGKDVRKINDTTIKIGGDTVQVGGTFGGEIDSLKQVKDTDVDDPYLGDGLLYDSIARKWKASSVYFRSLKDLLYAKDTLGVKTVKSFHRDYRTGEMQFEYISSGTPDYITSWPAKNFSGYWQMINVDAWISVEKLGALGQLSTRVTAAGLGYSEDDLTDLYGSYFTKATTDYIDVIAINQAIKGLGISGKKYRFIQFGSTTYYHNKSFELLPNYIGANELTFFGLYGKNTKIESWGGRYNVFMRKQTNYTNEAANAVNNRFVIDGFEFNNSDTAIGINSSYSSVISNNLFRILNVGVALRWNLATFVSNNRWDGYDTTALYIGHVPSFADLTTASASAYSYVINNRFFARPAAKKGIWIDEVNGVYIEQPIFEGGNPDYNVYIRHVAGGGNYPFLTNTREMKIMGGHLENHPDSACIYYESGGSKYLFIEKMYLQTPPSSPFVYAKGQDPSSRAVVCMTNMPYMDPGTGSMKMFRGEYSEWYFKNIPALSNCMQDTMYWYGGVLPEVIHAECNSASIKPPYIGNTTGLVGNVTSDKIGYHVGDNRYFGRLKVPEYTDSTTFSVVNGNLWYHKDRSKFYGGIADNWRPLIDSVTLFAPTRTATANGQILASFPVTTNFVPGAFTGLTYRTGQFITTIAGGTHEFYLANNSSAASSRVRLQLLSNNGGVTSLWSDGRLITSGTDVNLFPANPFSVKHTIDGVVKLNHSPTGLRIGDGLAASYTLDIAGKTRLTDTLIGTRGVFSRPTGYSGAFSLADLALNDFTTREHLETAVNDLQLLIESQPPSGISEVVTDSTLVGVGTSADSLRVNLEHFYTKPQIDSALAAIAIGEGYMTEVITDPSLTGNGTTLNPLKVDTGFVHSWLHYRIDSLAAAGTIAPDGSETKVEAGSGTTVEGNGTAALPYIISISASLGNQWNLINVEDHGAVANVNTSTQRNLNTLAFRSAFAAANSRQLVLVPGGGKRFYLDDSVLLASGSKYLNWLQMGDVTFVETSGKSGGYIIGEGSYHRFVAVGEISGNGSGATDSLSYSAYTRTGVYLRNSDKGRFYFQRIIGFHTGLKLGGESTTIPKGSQYNVCDGMQIKWNFIQVHITTTSTTDGSSPGDKGNWSTSHTLRDFQLGGGITPGIGGTIGILVQKMPSSNQANTNPFNYLIFDNLGFEGVYWGVIAENMDFSMFTGGGRIEEPAIQYPFYLSRDAAGGKECYANDMSGISGIYETYFYQGNNGYGTKFGRTYTSNGLISGEFGGDNGSGYTSVAFNDPLTKTSSFNQWYLDGLNGNNGERYAAHVYRGSNDFYVPFETKIVAASSTYSVATGVGKVMCTGTFTVTLPTASSWANREITIKNIGSGTITVTPVVSSNTSSIAAHEAVTYIAYSGGWYAKDQKPAGSAGSGTWTVNGSDIYRLSKVGIGLTTPTGQLHLAGGSTTANTASLKLGEASGLNTTPEQGAIENYQGKVYYTDNANDRQFFITSKNISEYGLGYQYSQISPVTVVATATETSLLQGGAQTLTNLNMNAGDALILEGGFIAGTPSPTTSTFTLELFAQGNTVGGEVWSSGSTLLNQANVEYKIKVIPESTGTSVTARVITTISAGSFPTIVDVSTIANFNTVSPSLNVTAQWSSASATHGVTSYLNTIEIKRFQ